MKKSFWRLAVALIISSCGFFGTVIWFEAGKHDAAYGNKQPVARLNDSTNEVQRKPLKRVIWENVNRNDELYPGEAVRTAPNAEARLLFIKSGTIVRLEPDSLVVLEETDKGLSLDFLQGNMFVQASGDGQGGDTGLTLKTGSGEIKLKSADMSLSKSANGSINLEVHRGEAELAQGGKSTSLNKENSAVLTGNGLSVANDRLQMLRPQAGETLYLNLARGEKVELAWKPLPAGYSVAVEIGSQRSTMVPVPNAKSGGEVGRLNITQKPGQWYMRLVATNADPKMPPMASTVIPFLIEPKAPPSLVEPRQEASVLKPSPDAPTMLRWVNRHKFQSQVLEVATDAQFKNSKTRENLAGEASNFAAKLDDGAYFWRVTGFLKIKDKNESLSSLTGTFSVLSKLELKPPILVSPANDLRLSFIDAQKSGVQFKWQAPKGIENFKLTVELKSEKGWSPAFTQDSATPQVRVSDLKPGSYRWTAASLDPKGGESKAATPFLFTVEEMQKIELTEKTPGEYEFHSPTPSLAVNWKPLATPPSVYRYKVASDTKPMADETWHTTRQTTFDLPVAAEGKYQVIVEALNAKGSMFAQSDLKTIEVKRRPLLPAPQWASTTPPVLKSDSKGNLTFGWEQVQGAQRYLMILESPDGKVIDQKEISRNTASLSRLKPGQYQVHLKSVDDFKRPGLDGSKRKLEVPNASDIRAPKIKAMKVK